MRDLLTAQWPLHAMLSSDLLENVNHRLRQQGLSLTQAGEPMWLTIDGYSIMLLLEHLVSRLHEVNKQMAFTAECLLGNRRVYLDIVWPGSPVAAGLIESWSQQVLPGLVGAATIADVLNRHNSEWWSQPHRRAAIGRNAIDVGVAADRH